MRSYSVSHLLIYLRFALSCWESSCNCSVVRGPEASQSSGGRTCPSSPGEGHSLILQLFPSHASCLPRFFASERLFPPIPRIKDKWNDSHQRDHQVGKGGCRAANQDGERAGSLGRPGLPCVSARGGPRCARGICLGSRVCSPADPGGQGLGCSL